MANQNILSIDRGSAKQTEKYLSDLIKQINVLNDKVNSVSLTNVIDPRQVDTMKKSLTNVVKQVEVIVTKHQEGVAQVTKATAQGMSDVMASAIDTKALKDASDLLAKLKADVAATTKLSGAGAGGASKEVLELADSVDVLQQQLDSYQTSTSDLTKSLGNVNDIYAQMSQTSGQMVDNASDMAAYADDMSFATRAASKDYARLATQAAHGAASFESTANSMNSFVGDIQIANDASQDLTANFSDAQGIIEDTDLSGFQSPLDPNAFDGLNEAADSISQLAQGGSDLGDAFGGASDQIDGANSSSKEMQKLFEMIAASVAPLPEMLKAMKVMVGQASSYAKQTGMASLSVDQMADTWQNSVINAVAIRDATIETAGAIKRIYGPEIAGSVAKLEASTAFIDGYWDNIYQNAKLAEQVNESMGFEAVKAASGSAAIMGHIQFSKRLLIEQKSMVGKARVLQVMARESIANNKKHIQEIQDQYDAVERKISGSSKSREWLSRTEQEKMRAEQQNYKAQQKQLELENDHLTVNQNILGVVNSITGKIQGIGAAVGLGVEADQKRLVLADKLDWVQKATAEKAWDVKSAADGLSDSIGAVELKSKRVDEYWGGIQANFKNGTGLMQNLLEGGLTGSTKQVALINTAQNLMKQQDTMANRIRAQRYIREERGRGAQSEIEKLEREWKGMDQAITDHNKGYIKLTGTELQNLKFRQKTIDAQRKALQMEVNIAKGGRVGLGGKAKDTIEKTLSPITSLLGIGGHRGSSDYGESILNKAAFTISDTFGRASDFFTRSDKYGNSRRTLQKQLLTMEEQSSRLSRESAKNNQSLANAIAGSYKQQRTAIVDTTKKGTDMQDIYANIETTSAKILEYWQKMFDVFSKMNGLSADGGMGLGLDPKDVKQEADGVEALADKIIGSKKKIDDLFDPRLIKKWGQTMGREYTDITELISDPKAFKLYEDDILGMLTRVVKNATGMSEEASRVMANRMIPALKEVEDAAAGKDTLKGKGYFFDDMDTAFGQKTKTINKLMLSMSETGEQAILKNGLMDPDKMAQSIQNNAERLSEMFSEDYFTSLKKTLKGQESNGAKTLQEFMGDPKLWAASRDSIASTLAQQFAALNGESAEFNYRLAHELLPTLDEARAAAATGKGINMDFKIDDVTVEDPEKVHTKLVEKIMKSQESPAANALLMQNKGLEGRDYMLEQIKNQKATGLRALQQRLSEGRGKGDTSALKSQMNFLSGELEKISAEYKKQLEGAANDAVLAPLIAEKQAVEDQIQSVQQDMDIITKAVVGIDTANMTAGKKMLVNAREGLLNVRDSFVGVLASAQESINIGQAVDNIKALGREQTQLGQLQDMYATAEKTSQDVMGDRYQSLIDAKKSLDQSITDAGGYDQGNFQLFLDKIKAIPQENAQALAQVAQQSYSQLDSLKTAIGESTDYNKIAMLKDIAQQQQQNIDDYKQMIQDKKGFNSGTAAKWQNRVGQISQTIQNPGQMKAGLMQTNFSDVIGNNFDDIQGKLLEFGSKAKGVGGIFKFLGENLGGVMSVLQGVNVGFDLFDRISGKSQEQIQKYSESLDKLGQDISNMIQTAMGATAQTGQQEYQQLVLAAKDAQVQADLAMKGAIKMTGAGDMIRSNAEKYYFGTTTIYGAMGEKAMEAAKVQKAAQAEVAKFDIKKGFYDKIAKLNSIVDKAQQAFQDLMDIEGQKVQAEFDFNKEKRADQADFDRQFKRDSEQKAMDLLYAQEDWAKQRVDAYKDNMQAILDIEKDYTKSIKDADKDMNESRKQSYKQLVKDDKQGDLDYQKSKAEAETNYQDQSYDNEKDYIKGMIQTQKDYAKERMRQERDLLDQLRDLEMNNDVLGYIQAKRDADKQMKDSDEDHNEQLADTKKQHAEERAANQKAHELEMADLEEQNADRKLQLTVGYLEEQQQRQEEHDKQLTQMQIDAQERLDEQVKAYGKSEAEAWNQFAIDEEREKARTAMAKRYADEDRAMQLKANQSAFDMQMIQFQEQENVARDHLIEYYRSQNMTQAEAEAAADRAIDTYHDGALKNLTDHGINMSVQADTNNKLMVDKEKELGQARFDASIVYLDQMTAAVTAYSEKMAKEVIENSKKQDKGLIGGALDNIGTSLSGIVAGAGYLLSLGNEDFAGKIFHGLKGYAKGGVVPPDEISLIGEKGPELFWPNQTGTIVPADITSQLMKQDGIKAFADGTSNIWNEGTGGPFGGRGYYPGGMSLPKKQGPGSYDPSGDPAHGRGFIPPDTTTKQGGVFNRDGVFSPGGFFPPGHGPQGSTGSAGGTGGAASGTPASAGTPTNTTPVVWSGGKPKAGNNRQGSTTVEVMPDSPALVVSDMHYQPGTSSTGNGTGGDTTDWESELNKLGPGRDKLADTKKRIDEIQTKFQANWLKIASTSGDYQSKIGAFDKGHLEDLYMNTFETYSKDLKTRREFSDKMVMTGQAYNSEAYDDQLGFHEDSIDAQSKANAAQLEAYKGLFTGMINSLTGGKADSIAIIDGLTKGATDLLDLFNVDGTGSVKNFVDNAGGFLKNLFGASVKSDEAGKKTESGMGNIFDTITSFVSDVPGTTRDLMSAGLAVLQGKAPDFATAFKATHDAAGKGIQISDQELMQNRKQMAMDTAEAVYTVEQGQLESTTQNVFDVSDIINKGQNQQYKSTKNAMDQTTNTVKNSTNVIVDTTTKGFTSVQGSAVATGTSLTTLQAAMNVFTGNLTTMTATLISLAAQISAARNNSSSSSGSSSGSHSSGGGSRPSDLEGRHATGGGRAGGGGVDSSHGYMVGERGPEWFQPNQVGRVTTSRDLKALMGIIPKAYDAMMTDIRAQKPDYSSHCGPSISLRIDSLNIGSDMSRLEIEQQFKRMQMTIIRTVNTAVG